MTGLDASHSSPALWSLRTMTGRQTGTGLGPGGWRGRWGVWGKWVCLHAPARSKVGTDRRPRAACTRGAPSATVTLSRRVRRRALAGSLGGQQTRRRGRWCGPWAAPPAPAGTSEASPDAAPPACAAPTVSEGRCVCVGSPEGRAMPHRPTVRPPEPGRLHVLSVRPSQRERERKPHHAATRADLGPQSAGRALGTSSTSRQRMARALQPRRPPRGLGASPQGEDPARRRARGARRGLLRPRTQLDLGMNELISDP